MSHVTCHVSHVTCHVSHVMCHVSHVTFFYFFIFLPRGWSFLVEGLLSTGPTPSSYTLKPIFLFLISFLPSPFLHPSSSFSPLQPFLPPPLFTPPPPPSLLHPPSLYLDFVSLIKSEGEELLDIALHCTALHWHCPALKNYWTPVLHSLVRASQCFTSVNFIPKGVREG